MVTKLTAREIRAMRIIRWCLGCHHRRRAVLHWGPEQLLICSRWGHVVL